MSAGGVGGGRGSVYKCKYGHNVGHTVCLLSFLHSFCFSTLFVVIFRCYFVVSVFFLFFFGVLGLMLQYFLMSLPGAQMGTEKKKKKKRHTITTWKTLRHPKTIKIYSTLLKARPKKI